MPPQDGHAVPQSLGEKIMHISLPISKETALMGSDVAPGFGPPLSVGNNFAVSVSVDNKAEADRLFNALSAGGKVIMPMSDSFWGSYFGMFSDKFGINWMVSTEQKK